MRHGGGRSGEEAVGKLHLGFYYMFLGPPEIVDCWGLGGPGGHKNHSKGWGRSPPPSGMVFGAAGAVQTPTIDDFRPAQKPCIKNPNEKLSFSVAAGPCLGRAPAPRPSGAGRLLSVADPPCCMVGTFAMIPCVLLSLMWSFLEGKWEMGRFRPHFSAFVDVELS